jgi:hypothetical protein
VACSRHASASAQSVDTRTGWPPSIDASEITDKGSINQRAVLKNRAALVEALYADAASPRILAAAKESR